MNEGKFLREENMERKISILGFAGSLRQGSYNRSLLRAALERLPGWNLDGVVDRKGNVGLKSGLCGINRFHGKAFRGGGDFDSDLFSVFRGLLFVSGVNPDVCRDADFGLIPGPDGHIAEAVVE